MSTSPTFSVCEPTDDLLCHVPLAFAHGLLTVQEVSVECPVNSSIASDTGVGCIPTRSKLLNCIESDLGCRP